MDVTMRQVQGDKIAEAYHPLVLYAFYPSPQPLAETTLKAEYDVEKYILVVFEDDMAAAGAASIPTTQNVRGKIYSMGAVSSVATNPDARRKGYAKQIMVGLLEHMKREGIVFSGLYPFRESFYGRLGYATFPQFRYVRFSSTSIAPLIKLPIEGTVKRMSIKAGYDLYREFLCQVQPQIHGMAISPPVRASRARDLDKLWLAVARVDGEVVGLMTYSMKGMFSDMQVGDFLYTSSQGKYLLLQWLARHVDQVKDIWIRMTPAARLETWAYDLNLDLEKHPFPMSPMGRVVIVEQIGGMQTGPGRFAARITDEQCPWNNGSYLFETVDGALRVTPTDSHECELTIAGLSALVFTGSDPEDFAFRGWGNPSPETQAAMRAMFPPAFPYMHDEY